MKKRTAAFIVLTVLLSSVLGAIYGSQIEGRSGKWSEDVRKLAEILDYAERYYVEQLNSENAIYGSIHGLLRQLDPHSQFLDPSAYSTLREEHRGHFYGLGITIQKIEDRLTVISPIEGTPAHRMGIRAGDVIVKIENESTKDMTSDQAAKKLRGPKGTSVTIEIARQGIDELLRFTVVRDEIPLHSVPYYFMLSDRITGFIGVKNFTETTSDELTAAIHDLAGRGMTRLVLDLRGNTGGILDQAIEVSDLFLPKGQLIVYTRGRIRGSSQEYYASEDGQEEKLPLIVLVNHGSASAAEIVAGAVQDHDRGLVIGETTWGKGLVQSIFPLKYNAALALTTSKYYTPTGRCIQRDYTKSFEDYYFSTEDEIKSLPRGEPHVTPAGRTVYGGGGIAPDIEVRQPDSTKFFDTLSARRVFFNYVTRFIAGLTPLGKSLNVKDPRTGHVNLSKEYRVGLEMLADFRDFLAAEKVDCPEDQFRESQELITEAIEGELFADLWGSAESMRLTAEDDPVLKKATQLFPDAEALMAKASALVATRSDN
ncbi:MAG: S41 family peptidase [Acidobacteria bacterium]|nr:S41 family peptidase [Acidobacteriota bacterium]